MNLSFPSLRIRCTFIMTSAFLAISAMARSTELPADCMPLSEVRIGMTGEARSVIRGFTPSPYKVEIIGIEHGGLPGSAMILARLEGEGLEKHGIVAGMSGSPVYIDGKIIGAVAYGWSFSYNPIAGITPIEHMLTMWDELDETEKPKTDAYLRADAGVASVAAASRGWDWRADFERYLNPESSGADRAVSLRPSSPEVVRYTGGGEIKMIPLSAPFFVSGTSAGSYSRLKPFFESRGLELFEAGSSAGSGDATSEPAPEIVNGSALSVPMLIGDMSIASIGTVTYRSGNKLLAFGHPMFGDGRSNAPMGQAYIFTYMQSYSRSFKLGESREIIGTIKQDRTFAIGGVIGKAPDRVPVHVKIGGAGAAFPRSFEYSAWEDPDFLPMLAAIGVDSSISGAISDAGELTADSRYTIHLEDGKKIEKKIRTSSRAGIGSDIFFSLVQDMFLLTDNPFATANVASIEAEVDVQPGFRSDILMRLTPRYTTVPPGGQVELDSLWRPFRGDEYSRRLTMELPKDLEEGAYVIHVADARAAVSIDQRHEPAMFSPRNLDETIRLAQKLDYPSNRLSLALYRPSVGVSVKSDSLDGLPGSISTLVNATVPTELASPTVGTELARSTVDFEYPIAGRTSVMIRVENYIPE